jgi:hypothetical protein
MKVTFQNNCLVDNTARLPELDRQAIAAYLKAIPAVAGKAGG